MMVLLIAALLFISEIEVSLQLRLTNPILLAQKAHRHENINATFSR